MVQHRWFMDYIRIGLQFKNDYQLRDQQNLTQYNIILHIKKQWSLKLVFELFNKSELEHEVLLRFVQQTQCLDYEGIELYIHCADQFDDQDNVSEMAIIVEVVTI